MFVTIILFDRNYNFIDVAYQASSASGALMSQTYTVREPGYAYLYISNEHPYQVNTYFDDVTITYTPSAVIQTDDYYPFGLTFNSFNRERSLFNNFQYNGKEKQDELDLGWLDYGARMYIAEIGRWMGVDLMAEKYHSASPFIYCLNNPVIFVDPNGMEIDVGNMTAEEREYYEAKVKYQRENSKLFNAMYSALEQSKDVYVIEFGETAKKPDGTSVDGNFTPNKDGGGTVTFLEGQSIGDMALSEELFHGFQHDNRAEYGEGEFNKEFEAKIAATAIGLESGGIGNIGGMEKMQEDMLMGEYGQGDKPLTPSSVTSAQFLNTYTENASSYAEYNQKNGIGNGYYKAKTETAPVSLQKMVAKAYGK